jgi:hypothetical protein
MNENLLPTKLHVLCDEKIRSTYVAFVNGTHTKTLSVLD